jgi:hypothetical protein
MTEGEEAVTQNNRKHRVTYSPMGCMCVAYFLGFPRNDKGLGAHSKIGTYHLISGFSVRMSRWPFQEGDGVSSHR